MVQALPKKTVTLRALRDRSARGLALSVATQRPFAALAAAASFSKEVLHAGTFRHPVTEQVFAFTRDDLEEIARDTNAYLASGRNVTFPVGADVHGEDAADARQNLGHWSNFRVEGDALFADVLVEDEDAIPRIGKTIRDVSVGLEWDVESPEGNYFGSVVKHVGATPFPVVGGMKNFVRLGLAAGSPRLALAREVSMFEDEDEKDKDAAETGMAGEGEAAGSSGAPADMSPNDARKALGVLLGADGAASWTDLVSSVRGLCLGEGEGGQPEPVEYAAGALSEKVQRIRRRHEERDRKSLALADRVAKLEKEAAAERARASRAEQAAVDAEIGNAKRRAAELGTPSLFGPEDEADVRAAFSAGKPELARRTIDRVFRGAAVPASSTVEAPNPHVDRKSDPERAKKREKFVASAARRAGVKLEVGADGRLERDEDGRPIRATK